MRNFLRLLGKVAVRELHNPSIYTMGWLLLSAFILGWYCDAQGLLKL